MNARFWLTSIIVRIFDYFPVQPGRILSNPLGSQLAVCQLVFSLGPIPNWLIDDRSSGRTFDDMTNFLDMHKLVCPNTSLRVLAYGVCKRIAY